jgi:uncharacterized NAD-dependent epimerase/dehydratase family protein
MPAIQKPYLLFIGDVPEDTYAKTAFGLRDWCPDDCVGQWGLSGTPVDLGIPRMSPAEAAAAGARSIVVAVAAMGGALPRHWEDTLIAALEAGLDVVAGLHDRLNANPRLAAAAAARGRALIDVREPPAGIPVGSGRRRSGNRLLTVGTDCALGKKYTALAMQRELASRGVAATFRATGQTGIMIAGSGIPIDAVVSDFVAGAAESISPDAAADHWDIIEGQGSLFHPAYAGVTLGLVHGSQPDAMILCHQPGRTEVIGCPGFILPPLPVAIARYEEAARLTNPSARVIGISLNTSGLSDAARADAFARASSETDLPACDPLSGGLGPIADLLAPAG